MSQFEQVIAAIRDRILGGKYAPGSRLMEIPLAEELGASRTPVRLALSVLEREGLVVTQGPKRGFLVRSFELEEVFDAIETRGTLEGMAARLAAERGLSADLADEMERCIELGEKLLRCGLHRNETQVAWVQNNIDFHGAVIAASSNRSLHELASRLNSIPLASPASIIFENSDPHGDQSRLERVQRDHCDIFEAIRGHEGMRAEMLMREHALMNIRNKKRNFATMKLRHAQGFLPGVNLIADADQERPADGPSPEAKQTRQKSRNGPFA
ncbi:MAG: GntR family transcriptional regulator [Rhizobiaceae bacterium]|nr:GntR family transcriptional regulator [Rhizobiaceae bacterium]MCV0407255.1 GntR family transcriptional regulator [Rhizobiaceae bacterium]